MKPTITLKIGTDAAAVADYHLILSLSGCGRGFVTAQAGRDCTGELVRLNLGMGSSVWRWFVGYVERCGPAENGWKRLYVRELASALEKSYPLSLQHPTMTDVCDDLGAKSGIQFILPDADYTRTPIPHFKSPGSGCRAVESLAGAFSVPDFVWYQLPDGTVYAGSYADSRFAEKPVDIPEALFKSGAGGNSAQLALIPSIRPGVIVNNQRIVTVEVKNGDMTLQWVTPGGDRTPEKRQIDRVYPELATGLHLPRLARVVAPTDTASLGDVADPFRPRYAVNLQLLDESGNDAAAPELVAVPLPVPLAGHEGGIYQYPSAGTVVEVGFSAGRPDQPFVRQTMQNDLMLPDIQPGEQLQQVRAEVSQRVTQAGSWQRQTDQAIEESSRTRSVSSDSEIRNTGQRETTVLGTDNTTVIGTSSLLAGAIVQIADGAWSVGASGDITTRCAGRSETVAANAALNVGGDLSEKITGIRSSAAAVQQLLAPSIVIGSLETNLMRLFTDMLDVIEELATLTADHSHPDTSAPTNAAALHANAARPGTLRDKYGSFIG
ncbi:TPA: hypothetical protein LVL19_003582 [Klebsiella michiganensis]|nr:hypothetical protein [Klebsiella michiganensis]